MSFSPVLTSNSSFLYFQVSQRIIHKGIEGLKHRYDSFRNFLCGRIQLLLQIQLIWTASYRLVWFTSKKKTLRQAFTLVLRQIHTKRILQTRRIFLQILSSVSEIYDFSPPVALWNKGSSCCIGERFLTNCQFLDSDRLMQKWSHTSSEF